MADTSMKIDITPGMKPHLRKICKDKGMTQKAVVERIVDWFAYQDPIIQSIILNQVPEEWVGGIVDALYHKNHNPERVIDRAKVLAKANLQDQHKKNPRKKIGN